MLYTNKSRFRINGKYGLFTIPKGILREAGWKPGDLIGFWGLDGEVIHIEKISKEKLGKDYNKKVYKKLAKFGGDAGTCGIKSLPEFLMEEFKPKNGQTIYFLPAQYSWFKDYYSIEILKNIVFAAFNPKNLKLYEKTQKETKEDLEKEYRDRIKIKNIEKFKGKNKKKDNYVGYDFGLFRGSLEFTDKNTVRARRKAQKFNIALSRDKLILLKEKFEKFEKHLREIESMKHSQKKTIIRGLKSIINETRSTIKELEATPERIFEEWPEDKLKKEGTIIR